MNAAQILANVIAAAVLHAFHKDRPDIRRWQAGQRDYGTSTLESLWGLAKAAV